MTPIIAFYSFTSESGKDTATQFALDALDELHIPATRRAFADAMKIVAANALGLDGTREQKISMIDEIKLDGYVGCGTNRDRGDDMRVGGRDFIIGLAESIREIDPTFWIRAVIPEQDGIVVISDLRFKPEAAFVRENGGTIIEIVRPGTTHRNEDAFQPDHRIINEGTLDDLRRVVRRLIWEMYG